MKFLFKYKVPVLCVSILVIVLVSIFGRTKVQGFTDLSGCSLDCSDKWVMLSMKKEFESNYLEGFQSKEGFQSLFSGVQSQLTPQMQAQLLTSLLSSSTGIPAPLLNSLTSSTGVPPSLLNSLSSSTGVPPSLLNSLTSSTGVPPSLLNSLTSSTGAPPSLLNSLTSSTGAPPSLLNSLSSSTGAPPSVTGTPTATKRLSQYKLRTVSRALQLSPVKCEYEITYDKTDIDLKGVSTNVKDQFGYFQATFTKNLGAECRFTPTEVRLLIGPEISKIDTQGRQTEIPVISYTF
jgi:hypothetical protein